MQEWDSKRDRIYYPKHVKILTLMIWSWFLKLNLNFKSILWQSVWSYILKAPRALPWPFIASTKQCLPYSSGPLCAPQGSSLILYCKHLENRAIYIYSSLADLKEQSNIFIFESFLLIIVLVSYKKSNKYYPSLWMN